MSTIGERIAEIRKEAGLNQTKFGALGGIGKHTQINYEKNERYPDILYLKALSEHGLDVGYVITGRRWSTSVSVVEVQENQPPVYRPTDRLIRDIASLKLSDADADMLIALARRLSSTD